MASPQFSVRIPPQLDERLKIYAAKNSSTKSEVMVAALAHYLGCSEEVPLPQKVAELEQRLTLLEEVIQSQQVNKNLVKIHE
jgi:predicted DNA-binding protein